MSHYTDLSFKFAVSKKKTTVTAILIAFCTHKKPKKLPRHDFFKCENWFDLFFMERVPILTKCIYTEVDNYLVFDLQGSSPWDPRNIELFVDWVAPHAKGAGVGIIGWSLYEESKVPEFYYGEL